MPLLQGGQTPPLSGVEQFNAALNRCRRRRQKLRPMWVKREWAMDKKKAQPHNLFPICCFSRRRQRLSAASHTENGRVTHY